MSESRTGQSRFRWQVVRVTESELESRLNEMDMEWEVFSVNPSLTFDGRVMGVAVPSEVQFLIIARQLRDIPTN